MSIKSLRNRHVKAACRGAEGSHRHTLSADMTAIADRNHLSMLMWDIADKNETCSMLTPGSPDNGMEWKEENLKEWAKLAKKTTMQRNAK